MQQRILGRTGLAVSEVGFGGAPAGLRNYLGEWEPADPAASEQIERAIERAIELGINHLRYRPGVWPRTERSDVRASLEEASRSGCARQEVSFVLSNPLVDVAIVGMRTAQEVEANCAIAEDTSARIDVDELHTRYVR